MKDTPIVILNKNRLGPLKLLVNTLQSRNYHKIIIIDNNSTYEPLLEWYTEVKLDVFTNKIVRDSNNTFYELACIAKHPKFTEIIQNYYVFTDPDVVPVEDTPDDFIDVMIEVCKEFPHMHKVGPNIKFDDFEPGSRNEYVATMSEKQYWQRRIPHSKYELYQAPIDTGFAVYQPNSPPIFGDNSIRMGGKYTARHIPFYYDINNLPEDELYYVTNLKPNRGPVTSMSVKQYLHDHGKLNQPTNLRNKIPMHIIKAEYGGRDCTEEVRNRVKNGKLIIRADNGICGDPAMNVVKYLKIEAHVDGDIITEEIREGTSLVLPKSNTDRLGIWYSNDMVNHPAVKKSLETIERAAQNKADIITCVWNKVDGNPFHEVYSWNKSSSHLNQLLQILQCIYVAKSINNYKYVSFLEHDVMYGEGYFDYPEFERGEVWTNMNYGGINRDGWQHRGQSDEPMHQMTMRMEDALEHFHNILGNALVTNSGLIESQNLTRKQWQAVNESIHINHGSHFTSHYNIYRKDDTYTQHPYWGNHENYLSLFH